MHFRLESDKKQRYQLNFVIPSSGAGGLCGNNDYVKPGSGRRKWERIECQSSD